MRRPQNLKKNLILVWKKQLFLLSSLKTSGGFFQFFVAFSEKLDFTIQDIPVLLYNSRSDVGHFYAAQDCLIHL